MADAEPDPEPVPVEEADVDMDAVADTVLIGYQDILHPLLTNSFAGIFAGACVRSHGGIGTVTT